MEDKLLRALFKASSCENADVIPSLLHAVTSAIPLKMCSFWKCNSLSDTVSIYAREKHNPATEQDFEYVHYLDGSLIGMLIGQCRSDGRKYVRIPDVSAVPYINRHKAPDRVRQLQLRELICIPIPHHDGRFKSTNIDGVLNLYPCENTVLGDPNIELLRDYISLSLSRSRLIAREELTRDIAAEYEKRASKDLASVLHPIIHRVLRKYMKYEGCSIFILDPFKNRLNLTQTTGISGKPPKSEVSYSLGEGLTGTVAATRGRLIIQDVKNMDEMTHFKNYEHKFTEETLHIGESFMAIPIMSPSHRSELLGVIRFTNRLNPMSDVVDRFSEEDFQLISHAMNLIALYMDYEQGEARRTAFAMQMAHEMLTPAMAIRGSARRLRLKAFTKFHPSQVTDYLDSILDHAELQIALNRSIEYVWAGRQGTSRASRYQVARLQLDIDILSKAKKLVIPIARDAHLTFDNIKFSGNFPALYLDKFAFEQVFFNLLTNAIKYRDYLDPAKFEVTIDCLGLAAHRLPPESEDKPTSNPDALIAQSRRGYVVRVQDCGMGVDEKEAAKIFNLGYRKKGMEKINVRGLGIGLSVAEKILGDFGCRIWVSGYRNPTVFSLFFPESLANEHYLTTDAWREPN